MHKIEIFYRHTETNKPNPGRPNWFNYENCFVNLLNSISDHRDSVNLTVYYDGNPENDFIMQYQNYFDLICVKQGNSLGSWLELHQYLKISKEKFHANTVFYLLENDYLHCDNWVNAVQQLYNQFGSRLNYVSLYDHYDKYFYRMYENLQSKIYVGHDRHWRTAPSTCASFLVDYNTYYEDTDVWLLGQEDHPTFLYLTEHRQRKLLTPMPALSTHCMTDYLSPLLDWQLINRQTCSI